MTEGPIRIPLEGITSSNLAAFGYDADRKILAIQFKSGAIYHYAGIDLLLANELYGAESRGSFYAKNIRGKFQGERMTGPCANCGDEGWVGDKCTDCGTAVYEAVPFKERGFDGDARSLPGEARAGGGDDSVSADGEGMGAPGDSGRMEESDARTDTTAAGSKGPRDEDLDALRASPARANRGRKGSRPRR
jgi:hypothetical protein